MTNRLECRVEDDKVNLYIDLKSYHGVGKFISAEANGINLITNEFCLAFCFSFLCLMHKWNIKGALGYKINIERVPLPFGNKCSHAE